MLRRYHCVVLFLAGTAVAIQPATRPASRPATRPARDVADDESDTSLDEKYTGPENARLEYAERQAYQKELKEAADATIRGMDGIKKARDIAAQKLAEAEDRRNAERVGRFMTQGTGAKGGRASSTTDLSYLRKQLQDAEDKFELARAYEAVNADLGKLAVHYRYKQYRTAWRCFGPPVRKMNALAALPVWNSVYGSVIASYRRMKSEAKGDYDLAYDKFIRPMRVKKKSLLEAILRDTGAGDRRDPPG